MASSLVVSLLASVLLSWAVLVLFLVATRPRGGFVKEALRLLPDTVRLLHRLAKDPALPRVARVQLGLTFVYLAMPIDLIPDFIPVIGHVDDVILVCVVLRSVVRRAGPDAVRRHWPGTADGLEVLWRVAGLTATP